MAQGDAAVLLAEREAPVAFLVHEVRVAFEAHDQQARVFQAQVAHAEVPAEGLLAPGLER